MAITATQAAPKRNYVFPLIVIGSLFFIFGFITWANSALIPYLKIACELTTTQSFYVATAFFAAYFVMAIPSSYILKKTGFKNGMSVGLFVMAIGALIFIPAANQRSYPLFLTGLFIIGTGLALLQTASNPYVTVIGPIESAAKRISIMGICNKIAGILAVYILGSIVLENSDAFVADLAKLSGAEREAALDSLASRVINPYIFVAGSLAVLGIVILFLKLPDVKDEELETPVNDNSVVTKVASKKTSVLQYPHLVLGALAIFFYVGVEVISYDTFANYGESLGYPLDTAKNFATYTGYGLLLGYIVGILTIPRIISQQKALVISCILSILLVIGAVFLEGMPAVICFALLGFSNAIMWPAIWPLAIEGLGRFTKIGSALLIMGIVGGAVLPPLYGVVADAIKSKQLAYAIMIPCYLYILYFAAKGHKAR